MSRTLLVMAAGTGGHIFPGIAIAKEMAGRGWKVAWMGTPAGMENKLVAEAGFPMHAVAMSGVRGKGKLAWLLLPVRLLVAFWQATRILFRVRPDVVLSMGGYVAFPGGMMAVLWGKPLVVHEPGATAGLTNRALALVADRVIVGMEGAFEARTGHAIGDRLPRPKRVEWLGTPVREAIAQVAAPQARYAGRTGPLRLLVVGGSLGAQTLNDLIVAALAQAPHDGALGDVGAAHPVAQAREHLGDAGHARAADADEVDVVDLVLHARDSQRSAQRAVASGRPRARAFAAIATSFSRVSEARSEARLSGVVSSCARRMPAPWRSRNFALPACSSATNQGRGKRMAGTPAAAISATVMAPARHTKTSHHA